MYTFVLELDGGTFLSQISAATLTEALEGYLAMIRADCPNDDAGAAAFLAHEWKNDSPVPVSGLNGVWCLSASCEEHEAVMHIIGTP